MEKNILITGGTKGIGFAVAKSLVTAGYNVILTYGWIFIKQKKHAWSYTRQAKNR